MDLFVVLVSALALVVSIGSAVYAKRGADETRELRAIESQRRHDERTPRLDAQIETLNEGQWHKLWLILQSAESLDAFKVDILDDPDVWFGDGQTGVEPGVGRTRTANWGALPIGKREAALRVVIGNKAPGEMRLLVTCTIGDDRWPVVCTVDLPSTYDLLQSVY
jgi:hypothetical protein